MGCKINDLNYVINNNKLGVNEFSPKLQILQVV